MNTLRKCIVSAVLTLGCSAILINLASTTYNIYYIYQLSYNTTSTIEPENGIESFPSEWQPLYDCRKSMGLVLTPVGINKKIKTSKLTEDNPAQYKYQLWKHTRE